MCVPFGLFSCIIVFLLNLKKKIKNHVIVEVKEKIFLPHYDSTILIPSLIFEINICTSLVIRHICEFYHFS